MTDDNRLVYVGGGDTPVGNGDEFTVTTVDAPMEVLGLLETEAIDCVVCDGDTVDWRQFYDRLRSRFLEVGFVLYAEAHPERIENARRAGVDRFVPREGGKALLKARVQEAVTEDKEKTESIGDARFHALAESVGFGVLTIDADSVVQFANPAIETILGWSPDELEGESLGLLIPDRLRASHFAGMQEYLDSGERNVDWSGIQLPAVHRNGQEIPVIVAFGEFQYGSNHYFSGAIVEATDEVNAKPIREAIEDARTHVAGAEGEVDVAAATDALDRALALLNDETVE